MKKSSSSTTAERPARDPALDRLRGALVVAMFAVHAYRLQVAALPSGALEGAVEAVFRAAMRAEPFVAAGFLFVSGWAVVLARPRWSTTYRRALALWALASLLCALQYGPAWPALVVSPGVLSVIGVGSVLVAAGERASRPELVHGGTALAAVVGIAWLDHVLGRSVLGLDAGPGGLLPLVGFAPGGALAARLDPSGRRWLALATAPALVVVLIGDAPLSYLERSPMPALAGDVALGVWLAPQTWASLPRAPIAFWNHSALGALALVPCLLVVLALVRRGRPLDALRGLSRHALLAYVGHLGVLGVLQLVGATPRRAVETAGLVALLTLGFTALGVAIDRARAPRSDSSAA